MSKGSTASLIARETVFEVDGLETLESKDVESCVMRITSYLFLCINCRFRARFIINSTCSLFTSNGKNKLNDM